MTRAPRNRADLEAEDELLAWAFPSEPLKLTGRKLTVINRKLTDPEIQGLLSESTGRVFRANAVGDDLYGDPYGDAEMDNWLARERGDRR